MNSRSFKAFWVMLLTLALIIPCMNGIKIQVRADDTDTATVWEIYGHYNNKGEPVFESVSNSGPVDGQDLVGKFIAGGTYTLSNDDEGKVIIADNAEVAVGSVRAHEFKLSGNSSYKYPTYTVSSTSTRFPEYPTNVASGAAITLGELQSHYEADTTPYFIDSANGIYADPYDLTVDGNMVIAGSLEQDETGNDIIIPNWIGYNDITVAPTGHISIEEGGHLLVQNSLTVETDSNHTGSITGSGEDHYLRVCSGATVSGLTLFADTTDVSTYFATNPNARDFEFRYENSNWIYPFPINSYDFHFNMDGLDPTTNETISVQYKYPSGNSYIDANPNSTYDHVHNTTCYVLSLDNIPESDKTIWIKITFTPGTKPTRTLLRWEIVNTYPAIFGNLSGNVFEQEFNLYDEVSLSVGYTNGGKSEIVDTVDDYLYAYVGNEAAIKGYLATELYNRFINVPMFENFGLGNAGDLENRITTVAGSSSSITATDKNGAAVTIPVTEYKIAWGNDMDTGTSVVSTIPVYTLTDNDSDPNNDNENFLICTNFDKSTGTGSTFYIRSRADEVFFDGGGDSAIPVVISSLAPTKIVAGGMGADTSVQNSDNVYSFTFNSRWLNANQEGGSSQDSDPANYGTKVRIMKASETYVMLTGSGETKNYGGIGNNGFGTDTIWNTRNDDTAEAMVYIGHDTLHLKSLSAETGVTVREITAVELADEALAVGVHIATTNSDIQITFDSNFYATIPLIITYTGGITKKLTINRVGLVIQYQYLSGETDYDSDVPDVLEMGFDHRGDKINVQYDYFAGEQIMVYGIYYTPTNDPTGGSSDLSLYLTFTNGTHRVITANNDDTLTMSDKTTISRGFKGKLAATPDAINNPGSVATTVFLIGFAEAKTFDGHVWIGNKTSVDFGGFYASVLNAGWDSDDSFGGAQVGSGMGIYWDGHISWY